MKEIGHTIQGKYDNHRGDVHCTSLSLDRSELDYKSIEQKVNVILESRCYNNVYTDFTFENKRDMFVKLTIELFEEFIVLQIVLGRAKSLIENNFFLCNMVFKDDVFCLTDVTCSYAEIERIKEVMIKTFINLSNGLIELDFGKE